MNISRVLIANRGEIAVRIIKACRALGLESVVAISEADKDSLPSRLADRAVCIGPARSSESYLKIEAIIAAALGTRSDAVHPGYGFLAEKPELAEACEKHQLKFIGPRPENIRQMGSKLLARAAASEYGIPVGSGSGKVQNFQEAAAIADELGYPLLLKAAAGGGGRGIKIVNEGKELREAFDTAAAEARAAFGDPTLYIERYISNARHIEVQVLGDRLGNVIHVGERDCSLQRRYQKVIEEAPAYSMPAPLRERIHAAAVTLVKNTRYENAGTVEFILDQDRGEFYFLEMNTRIQVEHPVTEMITGTDLVEEQIRIAGGQPLSFSQSDIKLTGHAIECRINAEAPARGFQPSPGKITEWRPSQGAGIRIDSHCFPGYVVPPYYDSLLAKIIVHAADRVQAIERMQTALKNFSIRGVDTTIPFLSFLLTQPSYINGQVNTRWLEKQLEHFSV